MSAGRAAQQPQGLGQGGWQGRKSEVCRGNCPHLPERTRLAPRARL